MNRIAFLIVSGLSLAACTTRPAAVPQAASDRPSPTGKLDRDVLVQEADQAFAESQRPDYRLPFARLPYDRAPVAALYMKACRAGDPRSCWLAMQLHDPDGAARAEVTGNCQRGDRLSCRALPWDKTDEARTELPGWAGRSRACLHRETCDLAALEKECQAGFPESCDQQLELNRPPPDMIGKDYQDSPVTVARILELTREGCQADIARECALLSMSRANPSDRDVRLAYERQCAISLEQCMQLGSLYLEANEPLKARDAYERDCQRNPNGTCALAADGYLRHTFPEPVPNRGEDLLKWTCDLGEPCSRPAARGAQR